MELVYLFLLELIVYAITLLPVAVVVLLVIRRLKKSSGEQKIVLGALWLISTPLLTAIAHGPMVSLPIYVAIFMAFAGYRIEFDYIMSPVWVVLGVMLMRWGVGVQWGHGGRQNRQGRS